MQPSSSTPPLAQSTQSTPARWKILFFVIASTACVVQVGLYSYYQQQEAEKIQEVSISQPTDQPTNQQVLGESSMQSIDLASAYLLINAARKEAGLAELKTDPRLELSAKLKITDLIANNYFDHDNVAQQRSSWHFIKQAGFNYQRAGEALSFGNDTAWTLTSAWLNSQEHKRQLLQPEYTHIGLSADCQTMTHNPEGSCVVVAHLANQ